MYNLQPIDWEASISKWNVNKLAKANCVAVLRVQPWLINKLTQQSTYMAKTFSRLGNFLKSPILKLLVLVVLV